MLRDIELQGENPAPARPQQLEPEALAVQQASHRAQNIQRLKFQLK
jgi:hypothetical protein